MTLLLACVLWCMAFRCHEWLQPRNRTAFPMPVRTVWLNQTVRALAPCLALALCLMHSPALGVLFWLGLGSVCGVCTSVLMAVLKNKRGRAPAGKPPL